MQQMMTTMITNDKFVKGEWTKKFSFAITTGKNNLDQGFKLNLWIKCYGLLLFKCWNFGYYTENVVFCKYNIKM